MGEEYASKGESHHFRSFGRLECQEQANYCLQVTVPELKSFLTAKNLSVAGKKQELVDRVEEYFETK